MICRRDFLAGAAAGLAMAGAGKAFGADRPPNIVFILADDVGYGDLSCYGANMVQTPNLDRMASQGVRFTDAHSAAAVCSPSRYSLLTGEYAFRNRLADHILSGLSPCSLASGQPTLPGVLRQAGYATGLVGKWHLGLGTKETPVNYNGTVAPGPLEAGFDSAFFLPATGDRVPCVFIEGHDVIGLDPQDPIQVSYRSKVGNQPTGSERPDLLKMKADRSHSQTIVNGISRIGYSDGGRSALWVDEDMADTLTRQAVAFIEHNRGRPFFLYYAPHDIHEPMAPHARFRGVSGCGSRGDAIAQLDWSVGEIMAALDRLGLAENTLIIFSSDNGGAIKNTYDDGTNALHSRQPPNGALRGTKGTLFEGGHRVPFIARWPGRIAAGTVSSALICQVDMLPTLAQAAGTEPPPGAGPDAVNVWPAFLSDSGAGRDHLVSHLSYRFLVARQGPWKLIPLGSAPTHYLFNLDDDPSERHNLALKHPAKAVQLLRMLHRIKSRR